MIKYPEKWKINYEDILPLTPSATVNIPKIITSICKVLSDINIKHLAYSGGIDSTIILCLMNILFDNVSTYIISSRKSHPDVIYAKTGSSFYKSHHHEFIVEPIDGTGDDAVKQLFKKVSKYTKSIITCDGIDEFMCGYYKHMDSPDLETYNRYISQLLPNHLVPLNKNSKDVKVYLPYLDKDIIDIFSSIPLDKKIDSENRKKVVVEIARHLGIPDGIITRNKYGFCDAFLEKDK